MLHSRMCIAQCTLCKSHTNDQILKNAQLYAALPDERMLKMLPEGRIHGGPKAGYETHLGARLLPAGEAVHVHLHLVPV